MNIVFQGDSITDVGRNTERGSRLSIGQGYALMVTGDLCLRCPGKYEFTNRGISGNRIVDVYARIKADCWNLNPDVLSILIGVNDVWHEVGPNANGVDAKRFEKVYRMLVEDTVERFPNIRILLLEPFVLRASATAEKWDYFHTETRLRAEAVQRIAEDSKQIFVPLQAKFDAACELAPIDYWAPDGVHPSPAGHRLIANEWLAAFDKAGL
ncbi:MAG: lysophospholipase [Ruminococcaceae bacterium]|nr:lysophospholipase [Oscillospiraceae bacterium]